MTKLTVGTTAADGHFTLPLEIGTQTSAVLGIRGSGKTVTATVIVEELLETGHQVVIIDPTDAWWGLKSSSDGSAGGYPVVIFGGPHGDLPLEPGMGPALADFAVEQRVPMILSLRHLRKGQQQAFVTSFAEQLYHRKGEVQNRTALLVAIDEASAFVPQRVGGSESRMVGAIEDLVRRGRSSGLGVMLIDQRPASVNKDVLTQLEVLIAHQITSPQDRKALLEWVKQHDTAGGEKTFLEQLSSLPTGSAWFWSPSLDVFERVSVRMRATFDSSRTPKPGEHITVPESWAAIDLDALREQLAESIEQAEENDPKALRRRIQELEKERDLAVANDQQDYPTAEAYERACEALRAHSDREKEVESYLLNVASHLSALSVEIFEAVRLSEPIRSPATPRPPTGLQASAETMKDPIFDPTGASEYLGLAKGPAAAVAHELPAPRQRILDTLLKFEALGIGWLDRKNLAVFSDQSPKSSAYAAHIAALGRERMIESVTGSVALTALGRSAARETEAITSLEQLHAAWAAYLPDPQVRMLRTLITARQSQLQPPTREKLAELTGQSPKSSAFAAHVSALASMGLVYYPAPGRVAASDLLFPQGLS